jgi:flagellar biogenesis protein FliO
MKKIGGFILFLPVMVSYWSRGNVVDTPKDLRVFKVSLVAQSTNGLDHNQVLILLLVTLVFVLLFSMALYLIVRRLIRIARAYRRFVSNQWVDDLDVHSRKVEESDLNLGVFTEQQWLLNQLLTQGHEDADAHNFVDLPNDLWS